MKFAVIAASGSQFKVVEQDVVRMDRMSTKKGEKVVFDQVLLVVDEKKTVVGKPTIPHAKVTAEVLDESMGDKIRVSRFKAKAHYHRVRGSRAKYSNVRITGITYGNH